MLPSELVDCTSCHMGAVGQALNIVNKVKDLYRTSSRPLADFVAANPNSIPPFMRRFQSGYRRVCDIYARTGAVGELLPAGFAFAGLCDQYLGNNLPPFSQGNTTVCLTFEYNEVASPGQPWAGPITVCGIRTPYVIKGPTAGSVPGFAGCIYAETPVGNIALSCTNFSQFVPDLRIRNVVESPDGGSPDSYTPTLPPPAPPNDYIFNDPSGPNVEIIIGSPRVDIDGRVNLIIDVGGIEVDVFAGQPGGRGVGDDGPYYPPTDDGPSVPTGDSEETGDTPEGKRMIGVRIFVTNPWPFDTTVSAGEGKLLKIPRHGILFFVDREGRDYGPFNVQRIQQVIPCPPENDFLKVRSVPLPNVSWVATPVYAQEERG